MPRKRKEKSRRSYPSPRSRKRKSPRAEENVLQRLWRVEALSQELVCQHLAEIQLKREWHLDKRSASKQQMMKYFGQAQGLTDSGTHDSHAGRAQRYLLKNHRNLTKEKLVVPKVLDEVSGLLQFGHIRVTMVPPFDYDVVIPSTLAGNDPSLVGSSDRNTGKMSLSAITNEEPGFNGGSMYTTVGVYFHPPTPGILTLSAAPMYSFQWWTNSLGSNDLVRSFGQIGLTVYGVDGASLTTGETGAILATAASEIFSWNEIRSAQIHFDFGFNVQTPVSSIQLNVNRNLVYLLFVDANVHVEGVGWPGSLAGAKLAVTVPYLTYDFQGHQVVI